MRVWSKGLGRVELAADLRKVKVIYDGKALLLTGKTEPPVSWEFVVVLSSTELWPMLKLVISNAGRRFVTKWVRLRLFDRAALQEEYKFAIKTRPGAKPEVEYAGIIQQNETVAKSSKTKSQVAATANATILKVTPEDIIKKYYELAKKSEQLGSNWFNDWFRYSMAEPFEAVDFIMKEVVAKNRCVGCAACVEVCPVNVFDFVSDKPADRRHSSCVFCGMCAAVCPPARLGNSALSK
ncbi:MAG: 4Fe-4S binding protein, partial [Nitrososphaerota archaeon]|nr:4Fe-4S binding protein [Nitrososphaerota archaeon]